MFKNAIFDWSGTVSNDLFLVYFSAMKILKKHGVEKLSFKEYRRETRLPYFPFYKSRIPSITEQELSELYIKYFNEVKKMALPSIYNGMKQVLEKINKKKVNMVVLSSHLERELKEEAKRYDVDKYFINLYGDVKDKRKIICQVLKNHQFVPNETIYIADMMHDIETGKFAKIKTGAVLWGYHTFDMLKPFKPDFIFKKNIELLELF